MGVYWDSIGTMEKKMETTVRVYIEVIGLTSPDSPGPYERDLEFQQKRLRIWKT